MAEPLRIGLVGAGPWAHMVHAPSIAACPETALAGVWARRPEAARALAEPFGAPAFERIDDLFAASDAVAFSIPPDVQADYALAAAGLGKHVVLEKPIAGHLALAERLARAIDAAGVASMVVLSWRYAAAVRSFIEAAHRLRPQGGRAWFVSGAFLGGPFATPWRLERGPLLDLGPHVIDLLDAALGPVTRIQAHGDLHGWVGLLLDHEGSAHSEASLCATARVDPHRSGIELFGREGAAQLDCAAVAGADAFVTLYREFAATVRGGPGNGLDVHRGLYLQRIIDEAERRLLGR